MLNVGKPSIGGRCLPLAAIALVLAIAVNSNTHTNIDNFFIVKLH